MRKLGNKLVKLNEAVRKYEDQKTFSELLRVKEKANDYICEQIKQQDYKLVTTLQEWINNQEIPPKEAEEFKFSFKEFRKIIDNEKIQSVLREKEWDYE